MKKRIEQFLAIAIYIIVMLSYFITEDIVGICFRFVRLCAESVCAGIFFKEFIDRTFHTENGFKNEIQKAICEIIGYIPILVIEYLITINYLPSVSSNQAQIEVKFISYPLAAIYELCLLVPIVEEVLFRKLPYIFLKKIWLYIPVTSLLFAYLHVRNDSNPWMYIMGYFVSALYLSYRYYKTKDILVTFSIHSFINLVGSILIMR